MKKKDLRSFAGLMLLLLIFSCVWDVFYSVNVQAADLIIPEAEISAADDKDYGALLAMSLDFFDENACGTDVAGLGVSWRGNCHTYDSMASLDKADNFPAQYRSIIDPDGDGFVDVSGGYHDAGDHVKFNLTMGFAGSSLVLSEYLNPGVYKAAGSEDHLKAIVKRNADYLMKTTFLDTNGEVVAVCHVVGNGNTDHGVWSSPESQTYERITYWLSAQYNNTAVCCEMASAIAGAAWLYKDTDAAYAAECVKYAKALLKFGKEHQGNDLGGLADFYATDGYYGSETLYGVDEMAMAEAWLWVLGEGGRPAYTPNSGCYVYQGVYYGDYYFYCWNKVWQGFAALMYKKTGEEVYAQALSDAYVNKQGLSDSVYNTFQVTWGVSRHNCAMQMTALALAKGDKNSSYAKAAKFQMDYILGNNPYGYSFLIGYGNNPMKIHHRAANPDKGNMKYILKGALVGGPDDNGYIDEVDKYQYTESALDYSGCFVLACSGLSVLYDEDKPGSPSEDKPGSPSEDKPGSPSEDKPGSPSEDKPGSPSEDKPGSPSEDKPGSPSEDKPGSPSEDKPGSPSEDKPDSPSQNEAEEGYNLAAKQKLDILEIMLSGLEDDSLRPVKFKVDNKKLASVTSKGILKAKKPGSVVVTGYRKVGKEYIPVAAVSVNISKPVFKFMDKDGRKIDLTYAGQTLDLTEYITDLPEGQTVSWNIPAKTKSASLNGAELTANKNGSVKVSCVIGEGKYAAKYTAVIKVKLPKLAESVKLKSGKTKTVSIKNVSSYTLVDWIADAGLEVVKSKDPRKVKIKAENAGEYSLTATIDGQIYTMTVKAD